MNFPENLKYSPEHTWLRSDQYDNTVGITEFAQSELGEIVFVDLPSVGATFEANEVFGSIEALKTVSDLFMPLSGEVIAVNDQLKDDPSLVNDDPFGSGWLVKIRIKDNTGLSDLLTSEEYQRKLGL